jgi:hypothetical protein
MNRNKLKNSIDSDECSLVLSGSLAENSRFGVRSWETGTSSEVLLGLSVFGASEKEGVGSYKLNLLNTLIKFKNKK